MAADRALQLLLGLRPEVRLGLGELPGRGLAQRRRLFAQGSAAGVGRLRDTFLDRLRLAQQALADRLLLRLSRLLQASHGRGAVALDGGVELRQRRPEVAPEAS